MELLDSDTCYFWMNENNSGIRHRTTAQSMVFGISLEEVRAVVQGVRFILTP